jgi:hypothetical protein
MEHQVRITTTLFLYMRKLLLKLLLKPQVFRILLKTMQPFAGPATLRRMLKLMYLTSGVNWLNKYLIVHALQVLLRNPFFNKAISKVEFISFK